MGLDDTKEIFGDGYFADAVAQLNGCDKLWAPINLDRYDTSIVKPK
jgi:hypothetical protein